MRVLGQIKLEVVAFTVDRSGPRSDGILYKGLYIDHAHHIVTAGSRVAPGAAVGKSLLSGCGP